MGMLLMDSSALAAVGFRSTSSAIGPHALWKPSSDSLPGSYSGVGGGGRISRHGGLRNGLPRGIFVDGHPFLTTAGVSSILGARFRAASQQSGSTPENPTGSSDNPRYHPFEEIGEPIPMGEDEDARLTDAEMSRTVIEVNSSATLLFSAWIDEVQENIFWPQLSYLTDEHGDIYFEVNNDEDILQTLNADDKLVQVFIGLDNIEKLAEIEPLDPSNIDFGIEEITNEDSDIDDDYEQDVVTIFEDDDDDDDEDDDDVVLSEPFGDWMNLETMHSSHPMFFAKKIVEVASNTHLDWMEQPSASIVIQGIMRPAFVEDNSIVRKPDQMSNGQLEKDEGLQSGALFYKLEIINIQLVSAYGNQSSVKVEDFRKARPDVLAHSAAKIISRLKSGGEKIVQALKSLCWRSKGIQVEEVALSGLDSLGFDLRVCSGTQVQTLRFAFKTRANSEYSAERQLHDLLFPRFQHRQQKWQQAHQKE